MNTVCTCGNSKEDWHLACAKCWALLPEKLQEMLYRFFKTKKNSAEHIQLARVCLRIIGNKRKGIKPGTRDGFMPVVFRTGNQAVMLCGHISDCSHSDGTIPCLICGKDGAL